MGELSKKDILTYYFSKDTIVKLCKKEGLYYKLPKEELIIRLLEVSSYSAIDFIQMLTKEELKYICDDLNEYKSGRKQDIINRIIPHLKKEPKKRKILEKNKNHNINKSLTKTKIEKENIFGTTINNNIIWMNEFYYNILIEIKKYQDDDGNYQYVSMNQIIDDMVYRGSATNKNKGDIKQSIYSMYQEYHILDFGGHGDYRLNSKGHNLYFQLKRNYEKKIPLKSDIPMSKRNLIISFFKDNIWKFILGSIIAIVGTVIGGLILVAIL